MWLSNNHIDRICQYVHVMQSINYTDLMLVQLFSVNKKGPWWQRDVLICDSIFGWDSPCSKTTFNTILNILITPNYLWSTGIGEKVIDNFI